VTAEELGLPASSVGYWLAEPDRAELARLMRHVVENPREAREVGWRAHLRLQSYGWESVTRRYLERINALAQRTPRRFVRPVRLDGRRARVFLHHPDWRSGRWKEVLASYCQAFTAADEVTLVLLLDLEQGVSQETAAGQVNALIGELADVPDVLLVPGRVEDLSRVYAAVEWLVPSERPGEREAARRLGVRVLEDFESWPGSPPKGGSAPL
jgi:hypothetical protein